MHIIYLYFRFIINKIIFFNTYNKYIHILNFLFIYNDNIYNDNYKTIISTMSIFYYLSYKVLNKITVSLHINVNITYNNKIEKYSFEMLAIYLYVTTQKK